MNPLTLKTIAFIVLISFSGCLYTPIENTARLEKGRSYRAVFENKRYFLKPKQAIEPGEPLLLTKSDHTSFTVQRHRLDQLEEQRSIGWQGVLGIVGAVAGVGFLIFLGKLASGLE